MVANRNSLNSDPSCGTKGELVISTTAFRGFDGTYERHIATMGAIAAGTRSGAYCTVGCRASLGNYATTYLAGRTRSSTCPPRTDEQFHLPLMA